MGNSMTNLSEIVSLQRIPGYNEPFAQVQQGSLYPGFAVVFLFTDIGQVTPRIIICNQQTMPWRSFSPHYLALCTNDKLHTQTTSFCLPISTRSTPESALLF